MIVEIVELCGGSLGAREHLRAGVWGHGPGASRTSRKLWHESGTLGAMAYRPTRLGSLRIVDPSAFVREVQEALTRSNGAILAAASLLGVSQRQLLRWLADYPQITRRSPGRPAMPQTSANYDNNVIEVTAKKRRKRK